MVVDMRNQTSDYENELDRITRLMATCERDTLTKPADSERVTKFVYLMYQRASLAGSLTELAALETAITAAIEAIGPAGDLYFLKANLDFKLHRLGDVKRDLETGRGLKDSPQGKALQADLDFQEGRYSESRRGYEALIHDEPSWDNLARLAHLKFKLGDFAGAERCYIDAENELTAKEMRSFAWVQLQRGLVGLRRGLYAEAENHYRMAALAYSGYWLVDEHMAELCGALGKFDEAVDLYGKVISAVPRPEFQQALGELYQSMGQPEEAKPWYEKALSTYLDSARQGEVHYYHHLTDFYCDVLHDGEEAVKWARKDIALRRNFSTLAALAWALYRADEIEEAVETMDEATSSGAVDAQLFFQAGTIYQAAKGNGKANQYLRMAAEINPHYHDFHAHR
jgi:tetratricopeptide (TPR) repeat protein